MLAISFMDADLYAVLIVIAFVASAAALVIAVVGRAISTVAGVLAVAATIGFFALAWNALAAT